MNERMVEGSSPSFRSLASMVGETIWLYPKGGGDSLAGVCETVDRLDR